MLKCLFVLWLLLSAGIGYAKNYERIDSKAEQAPSVVSLETLDALVQELTGNYSKEEDKARAILAWIVKNIDYDHYKYNRAIEKLERKFSSKDFSVPDSDILKVHLGVCDDISELYVKMAQKAGLNARVVSGYAGHNLTKSTYKKNHHSWVIVTINEEEKFIDPTWAIHGGVQDATKEIRNNTAYQKELDRREKKKFKPQKDRSINDDWFFTKPKEMIKTHYPDKEKDQLLTYPVSLSIFLLRSNL